MYAAGRAGLGVAGMALEGRGQQRRRMAGRRRRREREMLCVGWATDGVDGERLAASPLHS